jgi:hypothetical protein
MRLVTLILLFGFASLIGLVLGDDLCECSHDISRGAKAKQERGIRALQDSEALCSTAPVITMPMIEQPVDKSYDTIYKPDNNRNE